MQFTSMQGATSYNFNPRSRIGFDAYPNAVNFAARKFQSTKPYRLRLLSSILVHWQIVISIHEAI